MRRRILILLGFTALALAVAAPASALHCFVVKKPAGTGSVGTATFELGPNNHGLTLAQPLTFSPSGQLTGGAFLTVTLLRNGIPLVTADLYFHKDLPDGAHASGPGTSECDGVGIDDILECVASL